MKWLISKEGVGGGGGEEGKTQPYGVKLCPVDEIPGSCLTVYAADGGM